MATKKKTTKKVAKRTETRASVEKADSWSSYIDQGNKAATQVARDLSRKKKATTATLAQFAVDLRGVVEGVEGILKSLKKTKSELEQAILPERFDLEDISTLTLKSGDRITISQVARASVETGQKEAAIKWLEDHDYGDIPQVTINASTLSAFAKEYREEEGKDLPEKIFRVYIQPQLSVVRKKK